VFTNDFTYCPLFLNIFSFLKIILRYLRLALPPKKTSSSSSSPSNKTDSSVVPFPTTLREDFCGTAILCSAFTATSALRHAYGVDNDPAIISYAKSHTITSPSDSRVHLRVGDVRSSPESLNIPQVDILVGLNYGICYFQKYRDLIHYLKCAKQGVRQGGIVVVDLFGGRSGSGGNRKIERKFPDFTVSFLFF